jgi:7-cyano-7-deazaguanine reductase
MYKGEANMKQSFKYRLLRKFDHKCTICGQPLSEEAAIVSPIYGEADLLAAAGSEENLFWVYDRNWEDWLYISHHDCAHDSVTMSESTFSNIRTVISNLSTSLGKKTKYINEYDPSLLVPIPRSIARDNIGYEFVPFRGIDVWNAWEVSYLDRHGKPHSEVIRFGYDADSKNILESKSLKLYFNSFNQTIVDGSLCEIVKEDIRKYAEATEVFVHTVTDEAHASRDKYHSIDDLVLDNYTYEYNPELLTIKPTQSQKPIYITSNLLKSNCRHSGLPDWGTAFISYLPTNSIVEESSVLDYIVSFRNHQEFHEECCERIMFDLLPMLNPVWLRVELRYTRRGGLDINPIRVYSRSNEYDYSHDKEYSSFKREFRQ